MIAPVMWSMPCLRLYDGLCDVGIYAGYVTIAIQRNWFTVKKESHLRNLGWFLAMPV